MSRLASYLGFGKEPENPQFQAGTQRPYQGGPPEGAGHPAGHRVAESEVRQENEAPEESYGDAAQGHGQLGDSTDEGRLHGDHDPAALSKPVVSNPESSSSTSHSQQHWEDEADHTLIGAVPPSKPGAYAHPELGGSWGKNTPTDKLSYPSLTGEERARQGLSHLNIDTPASQYGHQSVPTTPTAPLQSYQAPVTPPGGFKQSSKRFVAPLVYNDDPFEPVREESEMYLTEEQMAKSKLKAGEPLTEQQVADLGLKKPQGSYPVVSAPVEATFRPVDRVADTKSYPVETETSYPGSHPDNVGSSPVGGSSRAMGSSPAVGASPVTSAPGSYPVHSAAPSFVQFGDPVPKGQGLKASMQKVAQRAQEKIYNTTHHLTAGTAGSAGGVLGTAWGKLGIVTQKVLLGGEHLFRQSFPTLPATERLHKSFACLLSTEAGAVAGVLYVSDNYLAFCSDRAMQRATSQPSTVTVPIYSYYKVLLPFSSVVELGTVAGKLERDRSLKIVMAGGEMVNFFGFVNFEKAVYNINHFKGLASGTGRSIVTGI